MTQELSFFDFKRKHSLSHSDIQKITGCTLETSRGWVKGQPVPEHITQLLKGIDVVIDRIKTEQGIFTNSDAQHAAHIIEGLNREIKTLKATIQQLQSNQVSIEGPEDAGKLTGLAITAGPFYDELEMFEYREWEASKLTDMRTDK